MEKFSYIYILANKQNGTLYIGVTTNLIKRVWQHKNKVVRGFTNKYNIDRLVYFEEYTNVYEAIKREKQLKSWERSWKLYLINKFNPNWNDLYDDICL